MSSSVMGFRALSSLPAGTGRSKRERNESPTVVQSGGAELGVGRGAEMDKRRTPGLVECGGRGKERPKMTLAFYV